MTQTTFTDNVLVDGSQDIKQLRVQGHTTQNQALQTWEDSAGTALAQMTGDGRLQVGDDVGLPSPDALIEAHRAETSTSKPKRGFHSLGRVSGTLATLVQWMVGELELRGSMAIDALHTALRIRATNLNTGTPTANAELRAADIEVINDATAAAAPLTKATGLQVAVTNGSGKVITDAVALRLKLNNLGTITNPYAIFSEGLGITHLEDFLELKRPTAVPGTPATDFTRVYGKSDGKLYAKNWSGTEYDLTGGAGSVIPAICNGRLTLSSGIPVLNADVDVTGATILYFTPYMGDKIALYDGTKWNLYAFSEISIELTDSQNGTTTNGSAVITGLADTSQLIVGMEVSGTGIPGGATISSINSVTQVTLSANATASGTVPLTFKIPAGKNVDVFCFDNSGTPKLEFGPLWTNNTTRATTLTPQNGVLAKTGTLTRRYLGTIRTTAIAGQTQCSFGGIGATPKWFVWNMYHRKKVGLKVAEAANSWTYTTAAWRQMNASATNQIELLLGLSEEAVRAISIVEFVTSSAAPRTGIALDVTNATHSFLMGSSGAVNTLNCAIAIYEKYLSDGYHYLAAVEYGGTGVTFRGDNNVPGFVQSGLMGEFWA